MEFSNPAGSEGCAACGHEHLVAFYETEERLVATVVAHLAPALLNRDAAILVATPEHREAFADELQMAGVDLDAAAREGRYLALDAADLLSRFMVDGTPDAARFREIVVALLDRVSEEGREVRVYGEMVALLWAAGHVTSTIALEDLWNELVAELGFSLFCGYPISGFDVQSRSAFEHICGQHSAVRRPVQADERRDGDLTV